jgi:hypothetical protein
VNTKLTSEESAELKSRLRDAQHRIKDKPKKNFEREVIWTFGEEQSPELEKTPDGKIWQHVSVKSGEAVIVRCQNGEFRPAKFLTITSSFGTARVIFEGDSESTLVHYEMIGRYVTPELVEGQILKSKEGKFYLVVREPPSGKRYQMALLPCEADGTPLKFAPLTWFTLSKMDLTRIA